MYSLSSSKILRMKISSAKAACCIYLLPLLTIISKDANCVDPQHCLSKRFPTTKAGDFYCDRRLLSKNENIITQVGDTE